MATYKRFEDLEVWQAAREQCSAIHTLTKKDPIKKNFDLVRQILRSSGSVMDNIAEGFEREGNKEFIQHLSIAKGSNGETRCQLYRAFDFEYLDNEEFERLKLQNEQISKNLSGFIKYLRGSEIKGKKFDRI